MCTYPVAGLARERSAPTPDPTRAGVTSPPPRKRIGSISLAVHLNSARLLLLLLLQHSPLLLRWATADEDQIGRFQYLWDARSWDAPARRHLSGCRENVCVCVCIYVFVCVYTYIHSHTHTHTHTHTHIPAHICGVKGGWTPSQADFLQGLLQPCIHLLTVQRL